MELGYSSSGFSFWVKAIIVFSVLVAANASSENAKTVEFNVKPGGVVHSFSEKIKEYECTFTYASQGGTNEQWQMSVGLSDDDRLFSCSVWSTREYIVPDPPGLFDGHVWPMYLKHRAEMEESLLPIEHLDGLKSKDEIYQQVYEDLHNTLLNHL